MRYFQALAGLALAAVSTAVPTPAHAAVVFAGHGALCSMDTTGQSTVQSGTISGGPFTAYNQIDPTFRPDPWVVCTLQFGGTGHFSDPDIAQYSDWQPGWVGVLAPTPVGFNNVLNEQVFVCSEIWIATGDGHFSIYYDELLKQWTTDPQAAACALAEHSGPTYSVATEVV